MEIAYIFLALFSALICGVIAAFKNRSGIYWFVIGFLFPVIAPLVLLLFKESLKTDDDKPTPKTHVKCPDCKELVLKEAVKCKHCGCKLIPQV